MSHMHRLSRRLAKQLSRRHTKQLRSRQLSKGRAKQLRSRQLSKGRAKQLRSRPAKQLRLPAKLPCNKMRWLPYLTTCVHALALAVPQLSSLPLPAVHPHLQCTTPHCIAPCLHVIRYMNEVPEYAWCNVCCPLSSIHTCHDCLIRNLVAWR